MNRLQIIQRFRDENPELTADVISDTTLQSWLLVGDKEICAKARLIVDTVTINAVNGQAAYDLTVLPKFFDIDENPGGSICRVTSSDIKKLVKKSKAQMDDEVPLWRTASSGITKYFYRRGQFAYMYPSPNTASVTGFQIDYIKISDDFNNDNITPYNQLTYLEPFHPALIFYLMWMAKVKIGKAEESQTAFVAYDAYVQWMIKTVGGGKYGPIEYRPSGLPSSGIYR